MDNQHRIIKGYRELSAEEIDLMNRIKEKGAELLALHTELTARLADDSERKLSEATRRDLYNIKSDEWVEWHRFQDAEPMRWASIGKTDIQTGIMALVRAIAQPSI